MRIVIFLFLLSIVAWSKSPWEHAIQNQMDSVLVYFEQEPLSKNPEQASKQLLDKALIWEILGNQSLALKSVISATNLCIDPDLIMLHLGQYIYGIRRQDSLTIQSAIRLVDWLSLHQPGHPLRAELTAELAFIGIGTVPMDSLLKKMDQLGLVRKWKMVGPFENVSNSGMYRVLPPEQGKGWKQETVGKSGLVVLARELENRSPDGWFRVDQFQSLPNAVNYFATGVISEKSRRAILSFGVSGAYTVWLNGKKILHEPVFRNMGVEGVRVQVVLKKGLNQILLKIGHEGDDRANFILRFSDSTGIPLSLPVKIPEILEVGTSQDTTAKIQTPSWTKLGTNLQDTMRLVTYYIQNDGFQEALPLLKILEKKYPQSGWVHVLLGEFYARQEKHTLADQHYQQARKFSPDLANGWDFEFGRRITKEDWAGAVEWFDLRPPKMVLVPDQIFEAIKAYLSLSRDTDAWAWVDSLLKNDPKDPDAWIFASGVHGAIGDRKLSVQLLEQAGDKIYSMPGLFSELLSRYQSLGDVDAAINILKKKLLLMPQSYSDWLSLANLYLQKKDLSATISSAKNGLVWNPFSYKLLLMLGRAYEMRGDSGDVKLAAAAYRKALAVPGAEFDISDRWLELEKRPTLNELRKPWALDSLRKEGTTWKEGLKNHWQILLSQRALMWHEWGGCEQSVRLIVQVNTAKGVDHWKEQDAMDHFWSGDVQVDRAVTHKADGRTIEADAYGTKLVFQGLEPGDLLELEVSNREQKDGPMAGQFWAWHFMAFSGPVLHNIFEIFTTEQMKNRYQVYQKDAGVEGKDRKVSGYACRSWQRDRYVGHPPESGMPAWGDVLPKVVVSSLPNWESVISWYEMLSEGKTVSSPELQVLADSLFLNVTTVQEKVERLQDWMERNIRYSHQLFRQSGYVPQDATKTLLTRIGDCKDMATLGKALLKIAGIKSELVLVNTNDQERKATLPMDLFNHCILWVDVDGGRYIDFTADQNGWEDLPRSDQLALSVRIQSAAKHVAAPIPFDLKGEFLHRENWDTLMSDGSLRRRMISTRGGNFAASFRQDYSQESPDRIRELSLGSLQYQYPGVDLYSMQQSGLDSLQKNVQYETQYRIRDFAPQGAGTWVVPVPWSDQIEPSNLPSEQVRHYPWVIWKDWIFWGEFRQKIHLQIPKDVRVLSIPGDLNIVDDVGEYRVSYKLNGQSLEGERVWIPKTLEVEPKDYPKIRRSLEKRIAADHSYLVLVSASGHGLQ